MSLILCKHFTTVLHVTLTFLEEWRLYGVWDFGLFADVLEGGEDALAQIEEGAQLGDFGGRVDVGPRNGARLKSI